MDREEELREASKKMLDDPIIIISYMEHYIDLLGSLMLDMLNTLDESQLTDEMKMKINYLRQLLEYSSIDFKNLNSEFESYKLPKAIEKKAKTRVVQSMYLQRKVDEGLF